MASLSIDYADAVFIKQHSGLASGEGGPGMLRANQSLVTQCFLQSFFLVMKNFSSALTMCSNDSSPPRLVTPSVVYANESPPQTPQAPQTTPVNLAPNTIEQYRLQLYNYALAERLRYTHPAILSAAANPHYSGPIQAAAAAAMAAGIRSHEFYPYAKFDPRMYRGHEEPKPQHSYIGLIAMAILSSSDKKLVLSDIYQYILDNYPYFRSRGPGWRNSIRHNLSLNDCFIKAGRSANGKGHYWAIHPANVDDFTKGDFRRRKAQRKVRKHMGLAVDEEDSPSPPPSTSPPPMLWGTTLPRLTFPHEFDSSAPPMRKRQFDVASLLAPDDGPDEKSARLANGSEGEEEEDIDVGNEHPSQATLIRAAHPWPFVPGVMFPPVAEQLSRYYEQLASNMRRSLLNNNSSESPPASPEEAD